MAQFNRFIFSLSKLGVSALERLFKASVRVHGQEHLPDGVIIFMVNHFTRLETLVLPYELFRLTARPVMSLVHHGLFVGALGDYLDRMGAVSSRDPNRDKMIIRSLLMGDHPWLIFPEGSMIKDKKIVERGKFLIYSTTGSRRPPHTGAAVYALRTEFYRQRIHHLRNVSPGLLAEQLQFFDLESPEQVSTRETFLVPVNVTYFPIRSRQNALENLATHLVKDIPERFLEELQTEGTMLLSGVDIDICLGKALAVRTFLQNPQIQEDIIARRRILPDEAIPSRPVLRRIASKVTMRLMGSIYRMTTVNYDHLAASLLKHSPWNQLSTFDLMERLYLATEEISRLKDIRFHEAIRKDQGPRPISEDRRMLADFLDAARQSGAVELRSDIIIKKQLRMKPLWNVQSIRRENPYLVILNEVEYLCPLTRRLRQIAWRPQFLVRRALHRQFLHAAHEQFTSDHAAHQTDGDSKPMEVGAPFLLKRAGARTGVLLVHGYTAAPEEVKPLAMFLHQHGLTVYACRLPGHGTSPADLAQRKWEEWLTAVERGYLILANCCRDVVLGGFSTGAGLVLLAAAANPPGVRAVFAINPPVKLRRRKARLAPAMMLWNKLVERISGEDAEQHFVPNEPENPDINYRRNPVSGVIELMELMEKVSGCLKDFRLPVLVIQGSDDPLVHPEGSEDLYQELGSKDKEFAVFPADRHVIIRGDGSERIFARILSFIQSRG